MISYSLTYPLYPRTHQPTHPYLIDIDDKNVTRMLHQDGKQFFSNFSLFLLYIIPSLYPGLFLTFQCLYSSLDSYLDSLFHLFSVLPPLRSLYLNGTFCLPFYVSSSDFLLALVLPFILFVLFISSLIVSFMIFPSVLSVHSSFPFHSKFHSNTPSSFGVFLIHSLSCPSFAPFFVSLLSFPSFLSTSESPWIIVFQFLLFFCFLPLSNYSFVVFDLSTTFSSVLVSFSWSSNFFVLFVLTFPLHALSSLLLLFRSFFHFFFRNFCSVRSSFSFRHHHVPLSSLICF